MIKNPTKNHPSQKAFSFCLVGILIAAALALASTQELRTAIPLLVGSTAAMSTVLTSVLYCGERQCINWSAWFVLALALVLRLMFLFSPPQLSDDMYRYLWDGSTTLRGSNPYALAPAAVRPPPELAAVHAQINHPGYITIYPPAAQLVFAAGTLFGGSITGLKALLLMVDLLLCALIINVLRRLDMPVSRAVLYAWNPLPVVEIAASGHVDGAGMTMVIGALALLLAGYTCDTKQRSRVYGLSGALLACAGMVKLFPFALVPLLFLLVPRGKRRYFAAGFVTTLAAVVVIFLPQLSNIFTSLNAYARNWEFAGYAFSILRSITGSGTIARLILSATFCATAAGVLIRTYARISPETTEAAKAREIVQACYTTAILFLLLTPTLQPWYALSLAAFLPFCAGPAGLVLCWAVFLTYRVQIPYFILGQWFENPYVTAAVFWAPVTAFLVSSCFRKNREVAG